MVAVETRSGATRGVRITARVLFWLVLLFIAFVTLSPIEFRPETAFPPVVERLAAFAVLGALAMVAYPRHRFRWFWSLILTAALLEAGQHLVAGRHGRMIDFDVKAVGTLMGSCVALAVESLGRNVGTRREL